MRLVCATQDWLGKYEQLCSDRQLGYTPWLSRMALLAAEGKELVAGVMVYDSNGPFLFFEHLVTNETATHRQRWHAVNLMAAEMLSMCRHVGKIPRIAVQHKGLKRILKRHGLVAPGAEVMTCHFQTLETHDVENPFPPPQHSRRFPDSAPTERAESGDPEEHLGVYASVLRGGGLTAG